MGKTPTFIGKTTQITRGRQKQAKYAVLKEG